MNKNTQSENNDTKKFFAIIILIATLMIGTTGATYAYFAVSATNNNTITGTAATVNLTLTVTKVFPTTANTNTGAMVPQLSTSASTTGPLSTALKNGCVDGNKNVVCQVYRITIQNKGGTATQVVTGTVSFFGAAAMDPSANNITNTMPNLKWKLITSVDETTATNSVLGTATDNTASSTGAAFASSVSLATSATKEYLMIIWINETNTNQTDVGKSFYGKISFNSSNGTGVTSTFTS